MLALSTSHPNIRTMQHVKSFRSCATATGVSAAHADRGRIALEEERLAQKEVRRFWLIQEWRERFERLAGPLRVHPPSGRFRRPVEG